MLVVFGTRACPRSVDLGIRHRGQDPVLEAVPQGRETNGFGVHLLQGKGSRGPHPNYARHILGARSAVPLLFASGEKGRQADAAFHPQSADTLRAVELVT
jgi:hypothetical protein